jgi:hypothetical protein
MSRAERLQRRELLLDLRELLSEVPHLLVRRISGGDEPHLQRHQHHPPSFEALDLPVRSHLGVDAHNHCR